MTDGLLRGVTSVGLQWVTDELGVDPFLGALGSNIIGAALEGMLNHQNIFVNVGEHLAEGIMSLLTLGGAGDDPWSRAVYISKVLDFSKTVREQGILSAMETYATSIFHQQTISMILEDGGILDMVTNKAEVYTDDDGILRKRLWATYGKEYYIDIDMESGVLLEKFERINDVDVLVKQIYDTDDEGNIITTGKIVEERFDDELKKVSKYDEKGNHQEMNIYNANGDLTFKIIPSTGFESISYDDNGNILNADIEDMQNGITLYFEDGELSYTSADIFGDDTTPPISYVRNPDATNLENAESLLDSTFEDINYRMTADDIFGDSAYNNLVRSLMLTSSKLMMEYGDEVSYLDSSLTDTEKLSFEEYARLRLDALLNPYDYYDILTPEEQSIWDTLKSPGTTYGFSLTAVHGMFPHDSTWGNHLKDVKVKGKNFKLTADSWNIVGEADSIPGDGLKEYWKSPEKRRLIIDETKKQIINGWEDAIGDPANSSDDIPFDVASHSLGAVATYEAVRELATERPDIKIRNVYFMGSPLKFFINKGKATYDPNAFKNVQNTVNIYNPTDELNLLRAGAIGALSSHPLLKSITKPDQLLTSDPVSDELGSLFSDIKDVQTSVRHGAMWKDPRMLEIVEEHGIFAQ